MSRSTKSGEDSSWMRLLMSASRQTVANATAAHANNKQIQNLSTKFNTEYGA